MIEDPRTVVGLHDTLLFMAAFPDDAELRTRVDRALRNIATRANELCRRARTARRLENTGIVHTATICALTFEGAAWLAQRFGSMVEIAWEHDADPTPLDELLHELVEPIEQDGLLGDARSTQEWFRFAKGRRRRSDLAFLIERLSLLPASPHIRERLFDHLDLRLRWRLREKAASRTFARFPPRRICYQREPLRRGAALDEIIPRPLPAPRLLPVRAARDLIHCLRAALAVRHRETDAVTYANPREVTVAALEDGHDVALVGSRADRRLPIESFFGFVVARNRVPIGYGGGWVFFDRCEIGVNIFDAFRGGESAQTFAQIMRVYHHYYRVRRFRVDPYQFGAGNPEAIRSGAFWFYYRLGFRPVEPRVAERAAAEWRRLHAEPGGRTSLRLLRRFAESPLEWTFGDSSCETPDVAALGAATTRWIAREFRGDRVRAKRICRGRLAVALGLKRLDCWKPEEFRALEQLSLLIAQIPDLADWPQRDRNLLARAIRAKGGPRERTYARALQSLPRLREALLMIARRRR
ncbi:MAG: hypothetical protein D6744_16415 [Planctomycetota bacterium]|nr:MAG: hypothetical protein D6744_16415 [Planctomycetota bacterium]